MSEESLVIFDELMVPNYARLGLITLNRPQALNALTEDMCIAIDQQLIEWDATPAIKLVVIRGNGERGFCAGGDVKRIYDSGIENQAKSMQFFQHEYQMNRRIKHFSKPYIALLHGISMGGGLGVSLHGSYQLAAENLKLAMPETGIGFYPDVGATYFLSRCPGAIGIYLGLTGSVIDVDSAIFAGLVQTKIPFEQFDQLTTDLQTIDYIQKIDAVIQAYAQKNSSSFLEKHIETINEHFQFNTVSQIFSSLEKDPSEFSASTLATLKTKSPMSLAETLSAIINAKNLNFDQAMDMELTLTKKLIAHPDFYEGVRAAIVDKDKQPVWQ